MVLFLNMFVFFVIMALFYAWWKTKKHRYLAFAVLFLIVYPQIQPSYMPKGIVERKQIPSIEGSKLEIEDRNRKPITSEIRNSAQNDEYKKGLEFIK